MDIKKTIKEFPDLTFWFIGIIFILFSKLGYNDYNLGWGYYSILIGVLLLSVGNIMIVYKIFTDKKHRGLRIGYIIVSVILGILSGLLQDLPGNIFT